jgi:hypothetical protein
MVWMNVWIVVGVVREAIGVVVGVERTCEELDVVEEIEVVVIDVKEGDREEGVNEGEDAEEMVVEDCTGDGERVGVVEVAKGLPTIVGATGMRRPSVVVLEIEESVPIGIPTMPSR